MLDSRRNEEQKRPNTQPGHGQSSFLKHRHGTIWAWSNRKATGPRNNFRRILFSHGQVEAGQTIRPCQSAASQERRLDMSIFNPSKAKKSVGSVSDFDDPTVKVILWMDGQHFAPPEKPSHGFLVVQDFVHQDLRQPDSPGTRRFHSPPWVAESRPALPPRTCRHRP